MKIPYWPDSTMNDVTLERNFIRTHLRPILDQRYPSFLKFYALQSQNKAHELGLSLIKEAKGRWWKIPLLIPANRSQNIFLWEAQEKTKKSHLPKVEFLQKIAVLSQSKRGKFASQFKQLQKSWIHHRSGEINFSGGVIVRPIQKFRIIVYAKNLDIKLMTRLLSEINKIQDLSSLEKGEKFFFS